MSLDPDIVDGPTPFRRELDARRATAAAATTDPARPTSRA
jgi:hypothetical protein